MQYYIKQHFSKQVSSATPLETEIDMDNQNKYGIISSPISKNEINDLRASLNNINNKNQQVSSSIVNQLVQSPSREERYRQKIDLSKSSSMVSKDDILQKLQVYNNEAAEDAENKVGNDMTVSQLNDKYIHIKGFQYSQYIAQPLGDDGAVGLSNSVTSSHHSHQHPRMDTKSMWDLTSEEKTYDMGQIEDLMYDANSIVSSILDEENGQDYFSTWFQLNKMSRSKIVKYIQGQPAAIFIPRFISMCDSIDAIQQLQQRAQNSQVVKYKVVGVLITQCQLAVIEALLLAIRK